MSSGSARLFVALELPEAVRAALDTWRVDALGAGAHGAAAGAEPRGAVSVPAGLRLIDQGALHLTLCFLGSLPVGQIDAIGSACRSALAGEGPLSLALGEPLWLPPRRPGVLAVRLRDSGGRLARVQAGLASTLQAGGWYEPERRAFLPHVTVARARHGARVRPVELAVPEPLPFVGHTVTLFRSRTDGSGARYEGLTEVALGTH